MALRSAHRNILTLTISLAFFAEMIDATALNTSLPQMAHTFMVNPILLKVVLISYLLSVGIFLPLSSFLADRYGARRLFIIANIIFCAGSIGSGLSHSLATLTLFRILQGLGGGFLTPVSRMIMVKIYLKKDLVKAQTSAASLASLGLLLGPLLGGTITTYLGWRFIFFINVPVNLFAIVISLKLMPKLKGHSTTPFDLPGYLAIALSIASLLFLFDTISNQMIGPAYKAILAIIPVLGLSFYYKRSRAIIAPLFKPALWQQKQIIHMLSASFILRLAFYAIPFLIPLILQASYGFNAFHAGLLLMFSAAGFGLAKLILFRLSNQFSSLQILNASGMVCILSVLLLSTISWFLNGALICSSLLVFGLCQSIMVSTINVYIYQRAPKQLSNQVITLNSFSIQLSASFAIAIAASFLMAILGSHALEQLNIPLHAFHFVFLFETLFLALGMALIIKTLKSKRP
jgi:MFS family permease